MTKHPHEFTIDGDIATFVVTQRNGMQYVITIDAEDVPLVSQYRWNVFNNHNKFGISPHYTVCTYYRITRKRVILSRLLTNCPKGMVVDHKNHDVFCNMKSNLRIATPQQNSQNLKKWRTTTASKYKGVHNIHRQANTWRAQIALNGKNVSIGVFPTELLAALAYDEAAKKYYGEFAYLNFQERIQSEERELCAPSCPQ